MRPQPIDLLACFDTIELTAWRGLVIDVDRLYHRLTRLLEARAEIEEGVEVVEA